MLEWREESFRAARKSRRPSSLPRVLALFVAVAGLLFASLLAGPAAAAHGPADGAEPARVPRGAAAPGDEPLTAADRDLLVRVRLAGLWEMPAGQLAAEKGANPRVRQVGSMIGAQHRRLDQEVVRAARDVGVRLPDVPSPEQQKWLDELAQASGPQFDQVFVDRLRAAHGKVFPLIADVRADTQNTVVRQLAQSANGFVLTHLTLLESTGLVDYASLPRAQSPQAAASSSAAGQSARAPKAAASTPVAPWYIGLAVAIAALVLMFRRSRRRSRVTFRRSRAARRRRPARGRAAGKAWPAPPSGLAGPGEASAPVGVRGLPSPYAPSSAPSPSGPYAPTYSPLLPPPTDLITHRPSLGPSPNGL